MRRVRAACIAAASLLLAAPAYPEAADLAASRDVLVHRFAAAGVPREPLQLALRAFACGWDRGEFAAPVLTLIDYARPSAERRLWVLDLAQGAVRFHELVTHGSESGEQRASQFSNVPGSRQTSLGLFRTEETYRGRHGYSLRLAGLEPGTNHLARDRGIVVHGADYATAAFARIHGRLGRSWGCPAVDPAVHREVIDTIREGTALFAYYPDAGWLAGSPFLHCGGPPSTPPLRAGIASSLRHRLLPFTAPDALARR